MNKTAKAKKCKEILNKYPLRTKIIDNNDIIFLKSVFENHSDWEEKRGPGVQSVFIDTTQYNNRCFYLKRVNGTVTKISYTHALKPKSKLAQIKDACRSAIKNEVIKAKSNVVFDTDKCPITNEILTSENTHIDHYNMTFIDLFNSWMDGKSVDDLFCKLNKMSDTDTETKFEDEIINKDFIAYHNDNTNLRAVSKRANLSILNRK